MSTRILVGDCREQLKTLPAESVHCCVTSPPYFGLRDYGVAGQIGLEPTPEEYTQQLVAVFREVRRVLRKDGTLWLNLGDSYASGGAGWRPNSADNSGLEGGKSTARTQNRNGVSCPVGIKPKDLIGIPWLLAFALRLDGWYLRQDIIWSKPNPMPESVTDRCTKAHEYLFLLSKSASYYYDAAAVAEPLAAPEKRGRSGTISLRYSEESGRAGDSGLDNREPLTDRNKRSVWNVSTQSFPEAHFATFPPALIEPCILAGCPEGGTILDPFGGAGTTALVADRLKRNGILIELNPDYVGMSRARIDAGRMGKDEGRAHIIKQSGRTAEPGPLFAISNSSTGSGVVQYANIDVER